MSYETSNSKENIIIKIAELSFIFIMKERNFKVVWVLVDTGYSKSLSKELLISKIEDLIVQTIKSTK